jgi:two-component system, cell cycle sensor histidine kinase and response regulator CckA
MKASRAPVGFAAFAQNQLPALAMKAWFKIKSATGDVAALTEMARPATSSGLVVLGLCTALVLAASVSSHLSQTLSLTLLAALAVCGLFFLAAMGMGRLHFAGLPQVNGVQQIADALPDAVMVASRLGHPVYANPMFRALVGDAHGSGLSALEATFLGQPQASSALFRLVRAGERGDAWSEDFEIAPTGVNQAAFKSLRMSVSPVAAGAIDVGPLVVWRIQDVTEERTIIRQRSAAAEQLLAAYDRAPVGLLVARADGTPTHVNATLAAWLGTVPGDERFGSVQGTLTAAVVRASQPMMELSGAPCDVPAPGGRPLALMISTLPQGEDSDGFVAPHARAFLVAKRSREVGPTLALGAADVSVAHFYQSAPFGIASVSASGAVSAMNGAFERLMGVGLQAVGRPAIDVLCGNDATVMREEAQGRLNEALAGWGQIAPLDLTFAPKTGPAGVPLGRRVYMSPLTGVRGSDEAAVLYVIDTTEQKALEAKFAQSQKMEAVGNLAGGLAHNFNNVLTAIIGSADLMLQTHRATDPAHKDIQNIKQSANRAAALVSQLMAFSRQQTLALEVLHLGEVMVDLRSMLKAQLQDKNELKITTDRDLWYVTADKIQIEQVLLNLAGNASHAMANGGTFSVRTKNVSERDSQKLDHPGFQVGEYVLIEAEDTGTGMTQDVLAKIFEPFFTTKEIGKGTGFGLATVYGIVKQLSGYIFPESTLGKGTIFRIYLPRSHVENEAAFLEKRAAKKEQKTSDLTGNSTVLVVEDEDMVRSVAVRSLTRLGYTVLEAANGLEALDMVALHSATIDIVVSDVVMPEMDGPSFLKAVRKSHPDLKIIFVSGHTNEAFKTTMGENEAFAFLQKPFSLPQLAAKVKEELTR